MSKPKIFNDIETLTSTQGEIANEIITARNGAESLNARLNTMDGGGLTLETSYTHTANNETDNTFTCVGHGLAVNDRLLFIINIDANNVYLPNIIPGGFTASTGYYVIADGLTENVFKLSATSGGASVDMTANVNLDLTRFHLEAYSSLLVTISDLTPRKKYKVHFVGRGLKGGASQYLITNVIGYVGTWMTNASGTFTYPVISYENVFCDLWATLDNTKYASIHVEGIAVKTNTIAANSQALIDKYFIHNSYYNQDITSIIFGFNATDASMANGSTVEVYYE